MNDTLTLSGAREQAEMIRRAHDYRVIVWLEVSRDRNGEKVYMVRSNLRGGQPIPGHIAVHDPIRVYDERKPV